LIDDGKTNFATASAKIFPVMADEPGKEPLQIAQDWILFKTAMRIDNGLNRANACKISG